MRLLVLTSVAVTMLCVAVRAQVAVPSDVTLAQQIVDEITGVKGGTSPADWLRIHTEEKLQLFNGRQLANDTEVWCARTVVSHSATTTGHAWTRSVYFYDPEPVADEALPAPGVSGRPLIEASCRLGLMWIDIPENSPGAGIRLAEDFQESLRSQYGPGSTPKIAGGYGSAGWTSVRQWRIDGGVITVAYDQFKGKPHRTLVRVAFANSDAVHDLVNETEQEHIKLLTELDELVRQVKEAGMPATAAIEMTALLVKPDYFSGQNRPDDAQVVAAFRDWLMAAKSQPTGQQAMVLLAADRVLEFLSHHGVPMEEGARMSMKSLGADYVHDELAGADVYAHGLLRQAKALAPPGPAADEILLFQMERGFDETGTCSAGAEEFSQVIEQGESLLSGQPTLPSSALASLHFMVGDAYATIVWLATPADTEYHDPKKYESVAESARERALQHYRAAFKLEHGTARAQSAWKEAWRLAAGLPPTSARYFCVYD